MFSAVVGRYLNILGNGKTLTGIQQFIGHLEREPEAIGVSNVELWDFEKQLQERINYAFAFFQIKRLVNKHFDDRVIVLIDQGERFFDNRLCMSRVAIFNNYFLGMVRKGNCEIITTIDDFGRLDPVLRGSKDHPGYMQVINIPKIFTNNIVRVKRYLGDGTKCKTYQYNGAAFFDHYETKQKKYSDRDVELRSIAVDVMTTNRYVADGILDKMEEKVLRRGALYQWIRYDYTLSAADAMAVENMVCRVEAGLLSIQDLAGEVGGLSFMPKAETAHPDLGVAELPTRPVDPQSFKPRSRSELKQSKNGAA